MGQIKKLVPQETRRRIVDSVDRRLPEGSFARRHFADAITLAGVGLVGAGVAVDMMGHRKTGAVLRMAGNALDDVDGDWARALHIDSEGGALHDSTGDKIKVLAEAALLAWHTINMPPEESARRKVRIGIVAAKHVVNAGLNIALTATGGEAHSSEPGKANMWADGVTTAAMSLQDAFSQADDSMPFVRRVEDVSFAAGVMTGVVSAVGYGKQLYDHLTSPVPTPTIA